MYHAKMKSFYVLLVLFLFTGFALKYKMKDLLNQENAIMHL
jgi:hypothetical protein